MNVKKMVQVILKPKYFSIILLSAIWFHLDSNTQNIPVAFERIYYYSSFDIKIVLVNYLHVLRFFIPYFFFIIFSFFFFNFFIFKI